MRYETVTTVSGIVDYRRNMRSMRCVTRKPPAMLIDASRMATAPEDDGGRSWRAADGEHAADDDDAADRVSDAHERRMQGCRDVPDHLPADDARQGEDREVREEGRWRDEANREQRQGSDAQHSRQANPARGLLLSCAPEPPLEVWRTRPLPAQVAAPSSAAATRCCRRGRPANCARPRRRDRCESSRRPRGHPAGTRGYCRRARWRSVPAGWADRSSR